MDKLIVPCSSHRSSIPVLIYRGLHQRHVHLLSGRQLCFPGSLLTSARAAEPKFGRVERQTAWRLQDRGFQRHPGAGEAPPRRKSKSCLHFGNGLMLYDSCRSRWNNVRTGDRSAGLRHCDCRGCCGESITTALSESLLPPQRKYCFQSKRSWSPSYSDTHGGRCSSPHKFIFKLLFTTRDSGGEVITMTTATISDAISLVLDYTKHDKSKYRAFAVTSCEVCVRRASFLDLVACKT